MNVVVRTSSGIGPALKAPTAGFRGLVERLILSLTRTGTTLAEITSSATLLVAGVVLAQPNEMGLARPGRIFALMLAIMPNPVWITAFLLIGLIQLFCYLDGNRRKRRVAAFCTFGFFLFVSSLGLAATPISILGAIFGVQALGQGVVYLHLGVNGGSPGAR